VHFIPALIFGEYVDVIVSVNVYQLPPGVVKKAITTPDGTAYVYYKDSAESKVRLFVDRLLNVSDEEKQKDMVFAMSAELKQAMGTTLAEIADNAGLDIEIIETAAPSFSNADVIMTTQNDISPAELGGLPSEIGKIAYVTPDGTIVYVFFKKSTEGTDAMINGLLSQKVDLNVTIFWNLTSNMDPFFTDFGKYTNVNIILYVETHGPPAIVFGEGTDAIVTNHYSFVAGCDSIEVQTSSSSAFVYCLTGAQGMTKLFMEWLGTQ